MDFTTNFDQKLPVYIRLGLYHKRLINLLIRIEMIRDFLKLLNYEIKLFNTKFVSMISFEASWIFLDIRVPY